MSEWIYLPSIPDWVSPNKPAPEPERRVYIPEHRKNADYWFKFYMGWDLSEFEEEYPKLEDLPSWAIPLAQRVKPEPPREPEVEEIPTPEPAPQPEAAPSPRRCSTYHWPFPTRDTVSLNFAPSKTTIKPEPTSTPRRITLRRHITGTAYTAQPRSRNSSVRLHPSAFFTPERPPPGL